MLTNRCAQAKLTGVEFIVCNTDTQSLQTSQCVRKIQLGPALTMGLGAGAKPEVGTFVCSNLFAVVCSLTSFCLCVCGAIGRAACEEALDDVVDAVHDSHMVFITAGTCCHLLSGAGCYVLY